MAGEELDDINVEYAQFYYKLSTYKNMEHVVEAAPILFAVQYLSGRISAESDRIIAALHNHTDGDNRAVKSERKFGPPL